MSAIIAMDSLACLLDLNASLEPLPEPFRMQNIVLKLPYAIYTQYISSMRTDADLTLISGLHIRRELAEVHSNILYKYYLQDVAFAIMKELSFAEAYHERATIIIPTSDGEHKLTCEQIASMFEFVKEEGTVLIEAMRSLGFAFRRNISSNNISQFQTAVVLYHLSTLDCIAQEIGIDV